MNQGTEHGIAYEEATGLIIFVRGKVRAVNYQGEK